MCMYDDGEGWDFYSAGRRVAAKPHTCCECRRTIDVGEDHHYAVGLYDGRWDRYRMCAHCHAMTAWLMEACNGWLYGATHEDLMEHVTGDEVWEARTKSLVRVARWAHPHRKHVPGTPWAPTPPWTTPDGRLRPVEDVTALVDRAIDEYRHKHARLMEAVLAGRS